MTPRVALIAIGAVTCCGVGLPAHRTVASPYTFHQDVRPILERRCGSCHGDGGVGSPLLTYEQARDQSWSIRQALVSGRMPPWNADAGAIGLKGATGLTARELDRLMTWASGGTPEGKQTVVVGHESLAAGHQSFVVGRSDLALDMPQPFTLAAGLLEADHEVVLPAGEAGGHWIRAVDLIPGTPAIVRRASIAIRTAAGEQTIGLWIPGEAPQTLEGGGAFFLPADGSLVLRIHYQRSGAGMAAAVSDLSRIGVHFADANARRVETIEISEDGRAFDRTVQAVALRPISGPADASVTITVVGRDESRMPLLRLQYRPEWPRRYVFVAPLTLARGSRIDVRVSVMKQNLWRSLTGDRGVTNTDDRFVAELEVVRP